MKSKLIIITTLALLSSTAHADTDDVFNDKGGVLYSHFLWGSYDSVQSKANQHCSSIGKGQPTIVNKHKGCLIFCGTEYHQFEFLCSDINVQAEPVKAYRIPDVTNYPPLRKIHRRLQKYNQRCQSMMRKNSAQNSGSSHKQKSLGTVF